MSDITLIVNDLENGYKQLEQGTFQEASEVQVLRRPNSDFQRKHNPQGRWIYTANLPLFRKREGQIEYGLSGRATFDAVAGEDIGEFCRQIHQNRMFRLSDPQVEYVNSAEDIVWALAKELGLQEYNHEWSYFVIDTSDTKAERSSDAQRPFAVKVHGDLEIKTDPKQENPDYGETMNMLAKARIEKSKIWFPTLSYIKQYLEEGQVVARASRLYSFGGNSYFLANVRDVRLHDGLCGVEKIGGADEKIQAHKQASEPLIYKTTIDFMRKNPIPDNPIYTTILNAVNHIVIAQEYLDIF